MSEFPKTSGQAARMFHWIQVLIGSLFVLGQTTSTQAEINVAKLVEIRARMEEFVKRNEIAGAVTGVGGPQGLLSVEAVGHQDVGNQIAMRPDSIFRIASMTKPITALGIMLLVDDGKLSVGDAVESHLPEFKGQMLVSQRDKDTVTLRKPTRTITIRDLLTHTSGMPGGPPPGIANLYSARDRTLSEAVMAFSQRPLDFEPGSKWAYCNAGIDTLGRIIEVVSGKSYETFLQERLFGPLGMVDTTFYATTERLGRICKIYDQKEGQLVARDDVLVGLGIGAKYPIPAGGLYSTVHDLGRLYQMMLQKGQYDHRRIISEASIAEMTKLQTADLSTGFTPGMGFGYGFAVVREPQGVTKMLSSGTFGHGGAFGTQGWIDPNRKLFVILLIQRVGLKNGDASDMRQSLQEVAFGAVGE